MQDKELYEQILGLLEPLRVTNAQLNHANLEIRVKVEHPRGTKFCCP